MKSSENVHRRYISTFDKPERVRQNAWNKRKTHYGRVGSRSINLPSSGTGTVASSPSYFTASRSLAQSSRLLSCGVK